MKANKLRQALMIMGYETNNLQNSSLKEELEELAELETLAEIGLATEFVFTESRYPMALCEITQIDCTQGPLYVTDTDSLIDLYNGLKESEVE